MTFRPATLSHFNQTGQNPAIIRGQNYIVRRFNHGRAETNSLFSTDETLFIFPEVGGELATGSQTHHVPPRAFAIAPPGTTDLRLDGPGRAYALTTGAVESALDAAINAADYQNPDPRVGPVDRSLHLAAHHRNLLRIHPIDEIPFPVGNSRLKFLQTATVSVNWVEYEGPRNRTQLSPHAHDDFEQGSLAISGAFVHHIRTPWVSDATQWRQDEHIEASADSLLIIPPELLHTTEGIGSGKHILIDIFAPPRDDFVAKGWVHNAGDYAH